MRPATGAAMFHMLPHVLEGSATAVQAERFVFLVKLVFLYVAFEVSRIIYRSRLPIEPSTAVDFDSFPSYRGVTRDDATNINESLF